LKIKNIRKETYTNLLIGSYKRDEIYVKKLSKKSSKKLKNIKNKFLIFIKIGVLNLQRCKIFKLIFYNLMGISNEKGVKYII